MEAAKYSQRRHFYFYNGRKLFSIFVLSFNLEIVPSELLHMFYPEAVTGLTRSKVVCLLG
jgi:hypothetical protein